MLLVLLSYRYVCVLICTENAFHANTRRHRQEEGIFLLEDRFRRQPHKFKRWPHHVCGVALCSMWYFVMCGEWILEVALTDSRGGPCHMCGVTLYSVWHLVPFRIRRTLARSWDTSSSSRHQACSAGRRYDCAINKSNSAGDMSTWDTGVQEYRSTISGV